MTHPHGTKPISVRVGIVTVSDTRTEDTDESGALLRRQLTEAGHGVVDYAILPDDPARVRPHVARLLEEQTAQAVLTTGGTGISPRDRTYEALEALLEKRLDGFGELFRWLSWQQVGSAAMLSRAVAGSARGGLVVALPGSRAAVELALQQLLLPQLGHMVRLLQPDE